MSALVSTNTGTLPGPTPKAGLPLEYAARTIPLPPVDRITPVRLCFISAFVASSVGSPMHWMRPSGAPACKAAADITATISHVQRLARGCGDTTIALPAFSAMITL